MLRLQRLAMERGAETLPIPQGARSTARGQAAMVGGNQPIGEVRDRTVRGAAGPLDARLYIPPRWSEPATRRRCWSSSTAAG